MPLFDYKCDHCDHEFEEISKLEDEITCGKCYYLAYRKISGCSFKIPGSTWNSKMQIKGKTIIQGLCKTDQEG